MPRETTPTARAGKAEGGVARLAGRDRSKIRVPLHRTVDESYDIEIGADLFDLVPRDLRANILPGASRIAIITDGAVRPRYGERLLVRLRSEGIDAAIFDFLPGEKYKTRETKAALEDALIAARFGRDSGVIALGGGVVSDLAGFVAGTFAHETNLRQVLNLGHTLGRALEPLADFSLSHGEAVAIGLVFQLRLGKRFGYVTGEEVARVERLIARIGLPTRIPAAIPAARIVEKMHTDKKARRDVIRFVFQGTPALPVTNA